MNKTALALAAFILPGFAHAMTVKLGTLSSPVVEDFETFSAGSLASPSGGYYADPLRTAFGWVSSIFTGQVSGTTSGSGGPWETVSGNPDGPLTLTGQGELGNTRIFDYAGLGLVPERNKRIGGLLDGVGGFNGALSMLFDQDIYELGIDIAFSGSGGGTPGGSTRFTIYDAFGSELGTETVASISDGGWILSSAAPFRGVTITNTDPFGVSFDDIRVKVPEPTTALLLLAALPGLRRPRPRS